MSKSDEQTINLLRHTPLRAAANWMTSLKDWPIGFAISGSH
jgi:hypothetical protein